MMQTRNNFVVRLGIAELGLCNRQAAKLLGISETHMSRKLRPELPVEKQLELLEKIREGVKKNGNDENN